MANSVNPSIERLHSGYLSYIEGQKNHTRWVALEKVENGLRNSYQLRLYKDDTETHDRRSKTLPLHWHKFIGTEQGKVKTSRHDNIAYFAIILVDETIMFQCSDIEDLNTWHKIFKKHVYHKSWLIHPKEGFPDMSKKTLHVTTTSVCLAHLNPPRFYKRWNLDQIKEIQLNKDTIELGILDEDSSSGFFLFSAEKLHYLKMIKETIEKIKQECKVNIDEHPPPFTLPNDSHDVGNEDDMYKNITKDERFKNTLLQAKPVVPPPLIKDCYRHFCSESLEETLFAIKSNKVCYRDSLKISPSQRQTLYVYMDAHEWWKEVAEQIGLNCSHIEFIKNLAPQLKKFCTEIVFYHWECMPTPPRECSLTELKNIAKESERPDIISILENRN